MVIGSLALSKPDLVKDWIRQHRRRADRPGAGCPPRKDHGYAIATHGWQQQTAGELFPVLEDFADAGLSHLLCTDISRDGALEGPNLALYRRLKVQFPGIAVQASGGIARLGDLQDLRDLDVDAAILARRSTNANSPPRPRPWHAEQAPDPRASTSATGRSSRACSSATTRVVGEILELARRYAEEGADELVFYDITASSDRRTVDRRVDRAVARVINIPFCVAGGIRCHHQPCGAPSSNAAPTRSPSTPPRSRIRDLISDVAERFGSQCVVVGIDSTTRGRRWYVYQLPATREARPTRRHTLEWMREAAERGAGESRAELHGQDGVRRGYDIAQTVGRAGRQ